MMMMMMLKASLVRLILAVGLCSVLTGEAAVDEQREEDSSELGNYKLRLRANEFVIQELGQRLKKIKTKLRSANFNAEHVYEIIENSASNLEGNGCEDNEFQCDSRGKSERQCISELLVCDGTKDCFNGQDEDRTMCRVPELRPGVSYSGFFARVLGCISNSRHAYTCQVHVASMTRSKVFPALASLEIHTRCTVHLGGVIGGNNTQEVTTKAAGTYSIGNRRWVTAVGAYSSECYFTDDFGAMWCHSRIGQTGCTIRLFYYRDD